MKRPLGVRILAGYFGVMAVFGAAWGTWFAFGVLSEGPWSAAALTVVGITVAIYCALAWGFWNLRSWAWRLAVVLMSFGMMLQTVLALLYGYAALVGLLVALLVLLYLFRPQVRAAFRPPAPTTE